MKDKLQTALGTFGSILYWVLIIFITVLPVVMIGAPFWLSAIIFLICSFVPYLSLPLWIWGLVEAIKGPQDVFAIIYYIATVIIFLPTIISMFSSLINKTKKTKLNKAELAEEEPKKKEQKSRFKTATIILSITTAMFAISTIGLSIGFANQIENLENTIEKKETAIHLLSNENSDLKNSLDAALDKVKINEDRSSLKELKERLGKTVCTDSFSPYYHTNSCSDCSRNGFTIWYDINSVENAGYLPCPNCIE